MIGRALAGFLVASALAAGARFARSLTVGGAVAAAVVGTAACAAGWGWAAVLLTFFLTSTALSRFRRGVRDARIADIVEKGDERDAWQVLANGGVFATAAAVAAVSGTAQAVWEFVAFGAVAAATADTWATEIGTLAGRQPRSIISWKEIPTGTSGGVTLPGLLASLAGASVIAAVAYVVGGPHDPVALVAGGMAGSLADSFAGATVQERRRCERCARFTERRVHGCGTTTRVVGGIPGVRNDLVNVVCTVVGGAVAGWLAR